jgi:hypothetical protein
MSATSSGYVILLHFMSLTANLPGKKYRYALKVVSRNLFFYFIINCLIVIYPKFVTYYLVKIKLNLIFQCQLKLRMPDLLLQILYCKCHIQKIICTIQQTNYSITDLKVITFL